MQVVAKEEVDKSKIFKFLYCTQEGGLSDGGACSDLSVYLVPERGHRLNAPASTIAFLSMRKTKRAITFLAHVTVGFESALSFPEMLDSFAWN